MVTTEQVTYRPLTIDEIHHDKYLIFGEKIAIDAVPESVFENKIAKVSFSFDLSHGESWNFDSPFQVKLVGNAPIATTYTGVLKQRGGKLPFYIPTHDLSLARQQAQLLYEAAAARHNVIVRGALDFIGEDGNLEMRLSVERVEFNGRVLSASAVYQSPRLS